MFLPKIHQLLLLLLLLLGLASAQEQQQQEEECVVGSNGEQICPEQSKQSEEERVPAQPTLDQGVDNNSNNDCVDTNEQCALWASAGECQARITAFISSYNNASGGALYLISLTHSLSLYYISYYNTLPSSSPSPKIEQSRLHDALLSPKLSIVPH